MNFLFVVVLFIFWIVISATLNPVYLITGAIVSFAVVWINKKGTSQTSTFSWFRVVKYGPWLLFKVLISAIHVSKLILHPKLPVEPRLHKHQTVLQGDTELTILGNSITLTPGTITIEIEPGEIIVHALDEASLADLQSGTLEQQVSSLFKKKQKDKSK